jgi:hypothetical protein
VRESRLQCNDGPRRQEISTNPLIPGRVRCLAMGAALTAALAVTSAGSALAADPDSSRGLAPSVPLERAKLPKLGASQPSSKLMRAFPTPRTNYSRRARCRRRSSSLAGTSMARCANRQRRVPRAQAAALTTASGRWFQHGALWCSRSQVGSDLTLKATTMAGSEIVRVQNWLYRWNGAAGHMSPPTPTPTRPGGSPSTSRASGGTTTALWARPPAQRSTSPGAVSTASCSGSAGSIATAGVRSTATPPGSVQPPGIARCDRVAVGPRGGPPALSAAGLSDHSCLDPVAIASRRGRELAGDEAERSRR